MLILFTHRLVTNYGNVCTLGMSLSHEYRPAHHCDLSITVVWLCTFVHTLPGEVRLFWRRPLSRSSVLFVANRYGSFLFQLFAVVFGFLDRMLLRDSKPIRRYSVLVTFLDIATQVLYSILRLPDIDDLHDDNHWV